MSHCYRCNYNVKPMGLPSYNTEKRALSLGEVVCMAAQLFYKFDGFLLRTSDIHSKAPLLNVSTWTSVSLLCPHPIMVRPAFIGCFKEWKKCIWSSVPSSIRYLPVSILASLLWTPRTGKVFCIQNYTLLAKRIGTIEWFFYWLSCVPTLKMYWKQVAIAVLHFVEVLPLSCWKKILCWSFLILPLWG